MSLSRKLSRIQLVESSPLGVIHKWRHASMGEGFLYICDTRYKDVSKIDILMWQRGEGGLEKVQIRVTSFMNDPLVVWSDNLMSSE